MTDHILTIADFRRLYCVSGIAKNLTAVGIDFRAFVRNGLPVSGFEGKGLDGYIDRVLEVKLSMEE